MNLLDYKDRLRLRHLGEFTDVWDPIRRKYVPLQGEEFVRQLLLHYLMEEKGYPKNRMAVERGVKKASQRLGRYDLLVYSRELEPLLICECKAPAIELGPQTLAQAQSYNHQLQVPYLLICNGLEFYCAYLDYQAQTSRFLDEIPDYKNLK